MTSQIVANIDTELKNKAMKMAKKEGITMKALLSFLLKGYVKKEIEIGTTFTKSFKRDYGTLEIEELNEEEMKIINSSEKLRNAPHVFSKLLKEKGII